MRDSSGNVDEGQVTQFAIGAIETGCQLRCEFKDEPRTFTGDLPKTRIRHLGNFALRASSYPGTASWLLIEQTHFTEELPFVQVGKHHFVAVFVFDHDFDRTIDDVIQDVRQIAGVNHDRLGRDGTHTAIAQKSVNCRYIAQGLSCCLHSVFSSTRLRNLF